MKKQIIKLGLGKHAEEVAIKALKTGKASGDFKENSKETHINVRISKGKLYLFKKKKKPGEPVFESHEEFNLI